MVCLRIPRLSRISFEIHTQKYMVWVEWLHTSFWAGGHPGHPGLSWFLVISYSDHIIGCEAWSAMVSERVQLGC